MKKRLKCTGPTFQASSGPLFFALITATQLIEREYHPQACDIIPGVFVPIEPDKSRRGIIVDYVPEFDERDLQVRIIDRKIVKSAVDFDSHKAVVSFGKGVKDSPEPNIKLVAQLAKEIEAEVGISLPISKKPFPVSEGINSTYMIPDRVIGTSGRKVAPLVYIAVGISGTMQHIAGMKESGFIVAINPDENSPIKDECDIFVRGRMEDVIPLLLEELRKQRPTIEVKK